MAHQHPDNPAFLQQLSRWLLVIAVLGFLAGFIGVLAGLNEAIARWLFISSLIAGGIPVAWAALSSLWRRHITINLLVTIAAIGASFLGQFGEAAAVMLFFTLAEAFQTFGERRSRQAITALLESSPKVARLEDGTTLPVDNVKRGQIVMALPGDTIPLDGEIVSGESSIDEATITGESMPKEKRTGDTVFAGTMNQNGSLRIKVTKVAGDSTLQKIVQLIEAAQDERPKSQAFLDRFASYYIPAALLLAALVVVIPVLVFGQPFDVWLTRGLIFLVLACPDALVVSAPVAVAAAIGGASRHGVLIKGGLALETLSKVRAIAFDKTKTLTVGQPVVASVTPLGGASREILLADAAGVEKYSSHPLADAIKTYAEQQGIKLHEVKDFKNVPGGGATATCQVCDTKAHALGNLRHIKANATVTNEVMTELETLEKEGMTAVLVSEGSTVIGVIGIVDKLRDESPDVVRQLQTAGVTSAMLTGDNAASAQHVASQVNISEVYADLLPDDKSKLIETIQKKHGVVAMVGDGVNDSPSLARADVGIAMGGSGSDIAIETADISLMNDRIATIPYLVRLAQQTFAVVKQNVYGSLIVKGIILTLGSVGLIGLQVAVAADAIAAIVVVLNGLRLFSVKPD